MMKIVFRMVKSDKQERLERQGCVLVGQELLDKHEPDPNIPCYCGRPLKPPNPPAE